MSGINKYNLTLVAADNQKYVLESGITIPLTIEVKYNASACKKSPITDSTNVIFKCMKTDECAIYCFENDISKNITVMNFASRRHPGGGYTRGSKAQEEDLCRTMPQLYPSLLGITYPYQPTSVLITPGVRIMRNNENYKFLNEKNKYTVNVVSAAAQNLQIEEFDGSQVEKTLVNLFVSVKRHLPETDTLIIGAWGCGAYRNDPHKMAGIMNFVCEKYGGMYKNIIYSIPGPNGDVFKDIITLHTSTPGAIPKSVIAHESEPDPEPESESGPEPESDSRSGPGPESLTRIKQSRNKDRLPKSNRANRKDKSVAKRTGHMFTDD